MVDTDELHRALQTYRRYAAEKVIDPPVYQPRLGTRVRFVEHAEDLEGELDAFFAEDSRFLGLDTEWTEGRQVALIQLCLGAQVLLLRPDVLRRSSPRLTAALADAAVLKCGVGIAQDLQLLEAQFGLIVRGGLELSALAARHGHIDKGVGLASICLSVLGTALPKNPEIRCSDWSAQLSAAQRHYAACDATVAVDMAQRLYECYAEPACSHVYWCAEFIDRLKLPKLSPTGEKRKSGRAHHSVQNWRKALAQLQALDGTHLDFVSQKRAEWYVRKGLAMVVSENPLVFQLLFEAKGRDKLGLQICCACGRDDDLTRFCVVPQPFRSLLNEQFQLDFVIICRPCSVPALASVARHRTRLFEDIGITGSVSRFSIDHQKKKVVKAAQLLLRGNLPSGRASELLAVVRDYSGKTVEAEVRREELEAVSKLSFRDTVDAWRSPPEQVAALRTALDLEEGEDFEQRCQEVVAAWREDFLQVVQPQFLPAGWGTPYGNDERWDRS